MKHTMIYADRDGIEVKLTVPWGLWSGRIPPPRIVFDDNGFERIFHYAGEDMP